MTYNYHYDVATSKSSLIIKLLLRWRGSVWQATYVELGIWTVCYGIISIIYRFALSDTQQNSFERFVLFCDNRLNYIPLNFMLGFFVQIVVNRWSQQFANLGMIDNIALFTSSLISGRDDRGRQIRRNIVRYCCLSQALVFRDIHVGVRKRFPNLDTLVAAGLMQQHEMDKFDGCKSRYAKYWLPFNWALHLLNVARKEGRITSDMMQNSVAQEIRTFRSGLSLIWTNDWVPLPIMYPQLITLATYAYFTVCLVSRQFIITSTAKNATEYDLYIPFMSMMELVFYMGWLKVAMGLLNPFGEDDEDFDCNFLLDRNMTVGLTSCDEAFDDIPDVQPDVFYNDTVSLLYSKNSAAKNVKFYLGSANAGAGKPFHLLESISHLLHIPVKEDDDSEKEVEMVRHPINERVDQYLQTTPRNRRGSSIISVVNPKAKRMDSFSSAVFRRRKTGTKNSNS
ncbi:unnamed protein product [Auanema sp. JU1783]|nr:unnamed protein product [Auanema sp. JU1783]